MPKVFLATAFSLALGIGVFMTCMASLYAKGLLARGCISGNANPPNFTDINITFKCDAITLGGARHDHMLASVHHGHCDLDAEAFNLGSIEWLPGLSSAATCELCHV
jgi:hypothetical protein